jgi:hypothetical protein
VGARRSRRADHPRVVNLAQSPAGFQGTERSSPRVQKQALSRDSNAGTGLLRVTDLCPRFFGVPNAPMHGL